MNYTLMSREQLLNEQAALTAQLEALKAKGLKLDMSRGKPCKEQLDMGLGMMTVLDSDSDYRCENGMDVRNYGTLEGIPEARRLFGELLGVDADETMVGGNSSLNLMYDTIARGYIFGIRKGATPYSAEPVRKWLCPVPGYDRHFAITQKFGFEMINIPMDENGPDMDMIEQLVNHDPTVKGIWCIPIYSNPGGVVYSDEVVERLAHLKPAADNFTIFYDNAYPVHPLGNDFVKQKSLLRAAKAAGNPDIVFTYASTSKCSFAGAGIAAMAMSKENLAYHKSLITVQTIGPDKINQLRHVRYFKNADGIREHMKKHAAILKPKFDSVLATLEQELVPAGVGSWSHPKGGYFISFNAPDGCAKRTIELCKQAGVVLTGAGAAFPYGIDPDDRNIRLAPSCPEPQELQIATAVFCTAVKLAAVEKLLSE